MVIVDSNSCSFHYENLRSSRESVYIIPERESHAHCKSAHYGRLDIFRRTDISVHGKAALYFNLILPSMLLRCLSLTRLPESTGWWLGLSTKCSNICTLLRRNFGRSSCQFEFLMIGLLSVSVSMILQGQEDGETFYFGMLRIISGSEWSNGG